jgi:phosphate starvation-inducible protein PhoH
VFITGDLEQCDHRTHDDSPINGLEDFLDKIKGKRSESISSVEFDICDVERADIVKEILEIYSTSTIPVAFMKEDE